MIMASTEFNTPIDTDEMTIEMNNSDWGCLARSYERGELNPSHRHKRGQLLYAVKGVMLVQTESRQWVIPPQRSLWLPAEQWHSFTLLSHTELRTLYFTPSFMAETCGMKTLDHIHVIGMTPFAQHLISSLFEQSFNHSTQKLIAQLLLRIVNETEALPVDLAMPCDDKLHKVAQDILVNNRWNVSLSEFAERVAMSERTFSRYFTEDTGCSFRTWKQRARIFVSMDLLSNGMPVKNVAYKLGFSCPSSFIAAFRTVTGQTPSCFSGLSDIHNDE
ncbi:AraC family transcriptional regulator [Pectobacterium brasiliense]|uniref:AraC family transcriptional regulator n=1 Tax=Pectobacterium brasiliense TaxID=180957 RepID=UPI001F07AAC5|nr:helix-turn-helix transcriptional regulator [Pectobacterium brasiliense]